MTSVFDNCGQQPIRYGMVGGGQGAFIGGVHRIAARMDGHFQLVAGALSSDPDRAAASGKELGLNPERCYASFTDMAKAEAARDDGIEAVSIVTPNHLHFAAAKAFLEAGIHVICDKPLTSTLEDAEELAALVKTSGQLFILTHNYTGYPMVRQARDMIARGELGDIQVVQAEYAQDWLTDPIEDTGQKQAQWRTDPAFSGAGGAIGDIGTHAMNLIRFVTQLKPLELCADLHTFGAGRQLDDNAHIMLRFAAFGDKPAARGMLWASQVAPGNENALKLRVFGRRGGLEWAQEKPNELWYTPFGEPKQLFTRGGAGAGKMAQNATRIPAGHPEGYLEAFGNIYSDAAIAIRNARRGGANSSSPDNLIQSVSDGLEGIEFIAACVRSSQSNGSWINLQN